MKNIDNLHFKWGRSLTYNKPWNFAVGERESGKTVDSWLKIWKAFHYEHRPSVILRRRIADITAAYLDDTANVLNKFLDEPVQLLYLKGDIKQGIIDIKLGNANTNYSYQQIQRLPIFFRVIALSTPMNRIKSLMLSNIKYFFMDEFIVNLRANEKYLPGDEAFLVKEIYTTYNREASTPITFLGAANPYSVYCPFFTALQVDTSKLKPGAFVVGPDYTINCFAVPDELKKKILAHNPMYQFDESYRRYAFNGEAINDTNIRLHKCEPKGFKLKFVFKLGQDFISVHKRSASSAPNIDFDFWVCKHSRDWIDKISKTRRKIIVFNFGDMINGSVRFSVQDTTETLEIKRAMNNRRITFNCIDAQYMLEDIYTQI